LGTSKLDPIPNPFFSSDLRVLCENQAN